MSRYPLTLRILYFIIAVLLLPASFSITVVVFRRIITCGDFVPSILTFFAGFISHLIFFLAFKKPVLAYVLGHELTHALWVLLFRGKVRSIRVNKNGGVVKATKSNPLIILAPYFFPLYTLLIIGIWLLLNYLFEINRYFHVAIFLIGFSWSFHFLLNLYILRESQSDIRTLGYFFSTVLIYLLNVFILGLLITFISGFLTFSSFFTDLKAGLFLPYYTVMDWLDTILGRIRKIS